MNFPAYRVVSKWPTLASACILSSSARNQNPLRPLRVLYLTVGSGKRRMRRFARLTSSTLLPVNPVDSLGRTGKQKEREMPEGTNKANPAKQQRPSWHRIRSPRWQLWAPKKIPERPSAHIVPVPNPPRHRGAVRSGMAECPGQCRRPSKVQPRTEAEETLESTRPFHNIPYHSRTGWPESHVQRKPE